MFIYGYEVKDGEKFSVYKRRKDGLELVGEYDTRDEAMRKMRVMGGGAYISYHTTGVTMPR